MSTLKEKIAIMEAFDRGEQIQAQYRKMDNGNAWVDVQNPFWDWYATNYRIKPKEPKVLYVNEYTWNGHYAYDTYEEALDASAANAIRIGVKYQEVID